jgi:hypothetical protein
LEFLERFIELRKESLHPTGNSEEIKILKGKTANKTTAAA